MEKTSFVSVEGNLESEKPILIIDKKGLVAKSLFKKINEIPLVFVGDDFEGLSDIKNLVHVPFWKKIPRIPDLSYSIIYVFYSGEKEIEKYLTKFIEKAEKERSKFIFIVNYKNIKEKLIKRILEFKSSKVLVVGDLFGNDIIDKKNTVGKFLLKAKEEERIEVDNDGLSKVYPAYIEDVIEGVLLSSFSSSSSLVFLFPKHPETELSLARIFQRINPTITIDFKKKDVAEFDVPEFLKYGEYRLKNDEKLFDKIKAVFDKLDFKKKDLLVNNFVANDEKENFPFHIPIISFIVCFLTLPLIFSFLFLFLGFKTLESTKDSIQKKNDYASSYKKLVMGGKFFELSEKSFLVLSFQLGVLNKVNLINPFLDKVILGKSITSLGIDSFTSIDILKNVFDGKSFNSKEDFSKALNSLKSSILKFEEVRAENDFGNLKSLTEGVLPLEALIDAAPSIFGVNENKDYLILFQNNMELRPGGGFIGSYGLLSMGKGRVKNFVIHDVYDADGQLKGHIEPSFALRRYLPSAHLYLRDSNFDVDFIKSASSAANLLYKETGQRVDGVIGVDISFVKKLLKAIGPVFVPDYNETVNSDNLYLLTQSHSEKNFFPGSTQKKDFLRSLFMAITLNFSSKKNIPYLSLVRLLSDSIAEKHLLFAFSDSEIQKVFTVNGMSSSLWDPRKDDKKTLNDFLGISEANIGVNKANYFVKREVSQNLQIDKNGSVSTFLSLKYQNESLAWPGGDYKAYVRVILPKSAKLLSIDFDGDEQNLIPAVTDPKVYEAKGFKAPKGLEVEKTEEGQKIGYGFLINVPTKVTKKITVGYVFDKKLPVLDPDFSYNLVYFKQPGTEDYPYSFSLTYPSEFKPLNLSSELKEEGSKITSREVLFKDKEININFVKE
ncbi:MAG: DUF4012 domain-containing protein [Patescibacteria group bacterium]|nr:DUF4012 domain-containing protein [Patescibacteria group bacterium]